MVEGKVEKTPRPFVLLDNEDFDRLSAEHKAKYIEQTTAALKRGSAIVTSNIREVAGAPDYLNGLPKKPTDDSSA